MKVLTSPTFKGKYEKQYVVSFRMAGYTKRFRVMVLTQHAEQPEQIVRDRAPARIHDFKILQGEEQK